MLASDGMKPLAPTPAPGPAPRGGNASGEGITVRCCGDWAQGAFGRSDRRSDAAELDGYVTVAAGGAACAGASPMLIASNSVAPTMFGLIGINVPPKAVPRAS